MKILYGVQGTGQGHISRARAMAAALADWPAEVTWLFSGRPREQLFDMQPFGQFEHRRGLTFATHAGRVQYGTTLWKNNLWRFLQDTSELNLSGYDCIVSDYEPVVSWAARRQGRQVIGIGHQYAFGAATPCSAGDWLQKEIMRQFAPVDVPVGLHWHPYAENILPPILDLPDRCVERGEHLLVYLPFEDQDVVTRLLQQFSDYRFLQYSAALHDEEHGNVSRRKATVQGFKQSLASCAGVICNSGFELISESLQWHKPVLTKPLQGQMEQHANALALAQLGYASCTDIIDEEAIEKWLKRRNAAPQVRFPNVANALAHWIATGCRTPVSSLAQHLWQQHGMSTTTLIQHDVDSAIFRPSVSA